MSKCCNSCGFLKENFGKPSPKGENSNIEWYSQKNLDRIHRDLSETGTFLICHSTDPKAASYGGKENIKPGHEMVCVGAVRLVFMHLKILEHLNSWPKYKKFMGKMAMSREALAEFMMMIGLGRTGMFAGAKVPKKYDTTQEISLPTGYEKIAELYNKIIQNVS